MIGSIIKNGTAAIAKLGKDVEEFGFASCDPKADGDGGRIGEAYGEDFGFTGGDRGDFGSAGDDGEEGRDDFHVNTDFGL